MAKGRPERPALESAPRIRRGYFECRYGQLHVYNAIPPGGGFDEGTPLLCLHSSPLSGATFSRVLALLGRDRSVYAPDLPGFGASDPPAAQPSIADYAGAVGDFLDTMRLRRLDVLGHQSGSFVAAELAITRPEAVRRLVCVTVPCASEAERTAFRRAPWPLAPTEDGNFLAAEWERSLRARGSGYSVSDAARNLAEKLRNGPHAWWGLQAALDYPARERLPRIARPTLVVRPRDEWWEATLRARELMPHARLSDLADVGAEAFECAPQRIGEVVRDFLRG